VLQGAMINPHFAKRGKTTSPRKLRQNALRLGVVGIDYRAMGYVTEVKDQVINLFVFLVKKKISRAP
jgi:hypothetical protein